ncbi:hypothetical protein V6N13_121468 [Hibiscus sabdariffa]
MNFVKTSSYMIAEQCSSQALHVGEESSKARPDGSNCSRTSQAKAQSQKAWTTVFACCEHIGQMPSPTRIIRRRLLTGRASCAARQTKILIFGNIFNFERTYQSLEGGAEE